MSLPDPVRFSDFVNLPDFTISQNSMDLPDLMQDFYPINGSYLIKGFDHLR